MTFPLITEFVFQMLEADWLFRNPPRWFLAFDFASVAAPRLVV